MHEACHKKLNIKGKGTKLMCESEQTEVPKGAYYLTLIPERTKLILSLEELEQRRLNENIEVERYLDYLIQKVMNERSV